MESMTRIEKDMNSGNERDMVNTGSVGDTIWEEDFYPAEDVYHETMLHSYHGRDTWGKQGMVRGYLGV